MEEKIPVIFVKQRVLLKKTKFRCDFKEGLAIVTYDRQDIADASYKSMKSNRQKVEIKGNMLYDYHKDKSAMEIYRLYIKDIEKAMTKNGVQINISYTLSNE